MVRSMKTSKCWGPRARSISLLSLYVIYVIALFIPGIDIYVLKLFNSLLAFLIVFMLVKYYEAKCIRNSAKNEFEEKILKAPIG